MSTNESGHYDSWRDNDVTSALLLQGNDVFTLRTPLRLCGAHTVTVSDAINLLI